jgi:hypothetical protein
MMYVVSVPSHAAAYQARGIRKPKEKKTGTDEERE